ncbi:IclR family transcriptional regulator [Amycolatopsis oliviviridis]|uniref:IclR family transcriptional regulator n=1 Tax=Amycolatopsis oliviviridis TaxID=1471590 RepID=A0ABQ3M127_9PSEU|nr:helix-turn-helix domain-containing protein [Amycolatopsis oliviviridis]GHH28805.1 IclR family transcriptional regulator [Amycolatopsis oliviviridis]
MVRAVVLTRSEDRPTPERDSPLGRSFAILQAIREADSPSTLSDIARKTGLPKSTVHRLLAELLVLAAVHKTSGGYQLGKTVQALAGPGDHGQAIALRRVFRPLLITVHTRTQYLAGLAIAVDCTIEWVDLMYSQEWTKLIHLIEGKTDLCTSAAGKALLAYDPDLVSARCAPHVPGSGRPEHAKPPANLATEMIQIRKTGSSMDLRGENLGIQAMAVPLFGASKQPIAALSIGCRRDRFEPAVAKTVLRTASLHAHGLLLGHLR